MIKEYIPFIYKPENHLFLNAKKVNKLIYTIIFI